MDYNLKESENKFIKNKKLSKYSDDKLAIAPGKINNPKYYNLGESVLDKNPINIEERDDLDLLFPSKEKKE